MPIGVVNLEECRREERKQNVDVRNTFDTRVTLSEELLLPAFKPAFALVWYVYQPQLEYGLTHNWAYGDMLSSIRATFAAIDAERSALAYRLRSL